MVEEDLSTIETAQAGSSDHDGRFFTFKLDALIPYYGRYLFIIERVEVYIYTNIRKKR